MVDSAFDRQEGLIARIFWVEDNADLHPAFVELLEGAGNYEVFVSSGGASALAQAKALHPHVVILDIVMPEMSGIEIAQRLRQMPETQKIPLIFLTAYEMEGVELPSGIPVLLKPIKTEELIQTIQKLLAT